MLNIFLFNLPKASEAFMKKLDKLAENSLLFKIVRFFVNSENDAADEKQSAAASKVTSSNANKARFFGFTGQAAIGNTLDEKKEKKSVIDPNEQSGVTNFLERMFPGLHDPKGSIVPQASTPAGDIAKAGNISNSTNSKVITIGEVKAEVIVQGSANSEETGLVIVEKINDAIAGQLRDVLAEGF